MTGPQVWDQSDTLSMNDELYYTLIFTMIGLVGMLAAPYKMFIYEQLPVSAPTVFWCIFNMLFPFGIFMIGVDHLYISFIKKSKEEN